MFPPFAGFKEIESGSYYGTGYQDVQYRRPSIKNAQKYLKWSPKIEMEQSVEQTLDFFLKEAISGEIIESNFDIDIQIPENEKIETKPIPRKKVPIISVSSPTHKKQKQTSST